MFTSSVPYRVLPLFCGAWCITLLGFGLCIEGCHAPDRAITVAWDPNPGNPADVRYVVRVNGRIIASDVRCCSLKVALNRDTQTISVATINRAGVESPAETIERSEINHAVTVGR